MELNCSSLILSFRKLIKSLINEKNIILTNQIKKKIIMENLIKTDRINERIIDKSFISDVKLWEVNGTNTQIELTKHLKKYISLFKEGKVKDSIVTISGVDETNAFGKLILSVIEAEEGMFQMNLKITIKTDFEEKTVETFSRNLHSIDEIGKFISLLG